MSIRLIVPPHPATSADLPPSTLKRLWPALAAATSGLLLALSFPPFDLGDFVWFWSFPLLFALWFSEVPSTKKGLRPRWQHGFRLGYLAGAVFFSINVFWITEISEVAETVLAGLGALAGFGLYFGLYFALFGAFAATVGRWQPNPTPTGKESLIGPSLSGIRVAFLNAAAWCGLEWFRGYFLTGFGWNGLGVALKGHLNLVQFADVIGISGYGFIVMFVGVILFCTIVRVSLELRSRRRVRPHFDLAVGAALLAGLFLYGLPAMHYQAEESVSLRARVIQLNIPLEDKWSNDPEVRQQVVFDYRNLTRLFVDTNPPDLILWPETAVPGLFTSPWVQEYLNDHILKGENFYLITGLEDVNLEHTEIYNTLTILKGDTSSYQMYRKSHLVPFGEFIPLRGTLPVFEWIAGGIIAQDFTPGDSFEPLQIEKEGHQIGVVPLICFEDTVARHTRKFIRKGPQILVNVTNDGWFHDSAQPIQHFYNAIFRCIEFRRPMIRAANTGVSGFIDEWGSVYDRYGHDQHARIVQDIETGSTYTRGSTPATLTIDLNPPLTIYARIGDSFSILMGLFALVLAGRAILRSRRALEV